MRIYLLGWVKLQQIFIIQKTQKPSFFQKFKLNHCVNHQINLKIIDNLIFEKPLKERKPNQIIPSPYRYPDAWHNAATWQYNPAYLVVFRNRNSLIDPL